MIYLLISACLIGLIGSELFQRILEKSWFRAWQIPRLWYN